MKILIVPECTKISGVRVKTPLIKPFMNVIKRRGNSIAYTPQCCTPNLSLFRTTPIQPAAASGSFKDTNKYNRPSSDLRYQYIADESLNYI